MWLTLAIIYLCISVVIGFMGSFTRGMTTTLSKSAAAVFIIWSVLEIVAVYILWFHAEHTSATATTVYILWGLLLLGITQALYLCGKTRTVGNLRALWSGIDAIATVIGVYILVFS